MDNTQIDTFVVNKFQFYDSTIKRVIEDELIVSGLEFQFYDSTIKSMTRSETKSEKQLHFNSTIVRLKVVWA